MHSAVEESHLSKDRWIHVKWEGEKLSDSRANNPGDRVVGHEHDLAVQPTIIELEIAGDNAIGDEDSDEAKKYKQVTTALEEHEMIRHVGLEL